MKGLGTLFLIVLLAVFGLGLALSNYSPGQVTLNGGGLNVHDPRLDAQATAVAQAAMDDAARRQIERKQLQAQADKAKTEAEATEEAKSALVWRNRLVALGTGAGVFVLVVGLAGAAVVWANKRANSVYPNSAGMYPVIVKQSLNGVTIVHDPNRALGPTTIYTAPSLAAQIGQLLRLPQQATSAQSPQPGSEATMERLSSQAQAVALVSAATRNKETPDQRAETMKTVTSVAGMLTAQSARVPQTKLLMGQDAEQLMLEIQREVGE